MGRGVSLPSWVREGMAVLLPELWRVFLVCKCGSDQNLAESRSVRVPTGTAGSFISFPRRIPPLVNSGRRRGGKRARMRAPTPHRACACASLASTGLRDGYARCVGRLLSAGPHPCSTTFHAGRSVAQQWEGVRLCELFLRVCLYYGKTQGDVPVPLFGC